MSKCNNVIDFNGYINKINKKKHDNHIKALAGFCHDFVDGIVELNEAGLVSDYLAKETLSLSTDLLFKVLIERCPGRNWLKI